MKLGYCTFTGPELWIFVKKFSEITPDAKLIRVEMQPTGKEPIYGEQGVLRFVFESEKLPDIKIGDTIPRIDLSWDTSKLTSMRRE